MRVVVPPTACHHAPAETHLGSTVRLSPDLVSADLRHAAAGVHRGRGRGTGKEACRYMLTAAGNTGDLLGCTRPQPARKLSWQADTQVCLPQNYSLATPRLVAACEPAGLLACIALVPLKHAIRALERLFAGLQGLVDILQVNQVCSGECTLRSHRGQRLRGALRSSKSSPGHAGRSRRRKHAHCQPGRVQAMLLSTWEAVCRAVLISCQ